MIENIEYYLPSQKCLFNVSRIYLCNAVILNIKCTVY